METTRLSSKGQSVLPRSIRSAKAWRPGQALEVVSTEDGVLLKPLNGFARSQLDNVVGCLPYKGKPKTIEQMHAAVASEAKRRRK